MDNKRYNRRQEAYIQDKYERQTEEAYSGPPLEDFGEDFRMPIDQRPTENLDTDNLEQASLDTQLTSSNIGYRLLEKMGWKGKGLGKNEQAPFSDDNRLQRSHLLGLFSFSGGSAVFLLLRQCSLLLRQHIFSGIVEPIRAGIRDPKLGVGKQEQDDFFTAEENIQRKKLDVEVEETEELAKKREVIAEREQKILTEVKEIKKVFFCNLCSKQYKLAIEFEAHLSSYDHNHRKRFKEMKEMHGGSNRDDRKKREQLRQEKEMAKFAQMADAKKQRQLKQQEQSGEPPVSAPLNGTRFILQDQRQALKFGFSSKPGASKTSTGSITKKPKLPLKVSSIFSNDSDDES